MGCRSLPGFRTMLPPEALPYQADSSLHYFERAVILSKGGPLQFQLRESAANSPTPIAAVPPTQKQWLESQRATIRAALEKSGGKIYGKGGAAELLGLRPTTLSSRIAALGIKRKSV
jgi:transcriptional regulator with GAF, ATPase, and Fis domain